MKLVSILLCTFAGALLAGAYWVFGDGVIDYRVVQKHPATQPYEFKWVVPGLLTTLAIVALNVGVTPSKVVESWEARLWAFCCMTAAFVGMGLSIWILVADVLIGGAQAGNWTAISILLQTMMVITAGLLFFVRDGCKTRNDDYGNL